MLGKILVAFLLPVLSHSASLTFFEGRGCTGQPLFGGNFDDSLPCFDLSSYAPANSTSVERFALGQTVRFYSDAKCENLAYITASDVCYLHTGTNIAAVRVESERESMSAASPTLESFTKDVEVYKMVDYTGTTAIALSPNLPLSDFFIAYALDIGAGLVTFASVAIGCYSATSGGALAITGCILGPLATGLAFASGYFKGKAGRTMRGQGNVALGQLNSGTPGGTGKRGLIDSWNYDYLADAMQWSGANASHVGSMLHDLGDGEQTSPVFEFQGGDGADYHIAAFYSQDSDVFVHRVYLAQHAELNKRAGPGYLNVRWNSGGYDFALCNYNSAADTSDFNGKDLNDMYSTYYQELGCLLSADRLKQQTSVYFEIFNGHRNLISGIEFVPFDGDNGKAVSPLKCSKSTTQDQSCVY